MIDSISSIIPEYLYKLLLSLSKEGSKIYLIGGVVRDILLNRETHDIDLVTEGDAILLGRKTANKLGGDFYVLDHQRKTARVLSELPDGRQLVIDFAVIQGKDLLSDLAIRDFTVNAMALDLCKPDHLVDPLDGAADLRNGVLRACGPETFTQDPIRILRGIRLGFDLEFKLQKETWQLMKSSSRALEQVSRERQRDELFKIFEGRHISSAVRLIQRVGALDIIFPPVSSLRNLSESSVNGNTALERTYIMLQKTEELFNALGVGGRQDRNQNLVFGTAVITLADFRSSIREHFEQSLSAGRSVQALMYLAVLLHSLCSLLVSDEVENTASKRAQKAAEIAKSLALSQAEARRLSLIVQYQNLFGDLMRKNRLPYRREMYQYFMKTREAGIDICFLNLISTLSDYRSALPQDEWQSQLKVCCVLMDAWWKQKNEIVDPPRFVTGSDIRSEFNLNSGPIIGKALDAVREEQSSGEIRSKEEAISFLRTWMENLKEND